MQEHQIIIFDGVCNFCNGAVNFIINRDAKAVFKFAPLQSEVAQELMAQHQIQALAEDSFILIKDDQCFLRTDAALEITKELDGFWCVLRVFKFLPRVIRDYFYRLLARNRYRLFGQQTECMIPTADVRDRFLI